MKRDKNLKITPQTHKILKDYCEKNGLKMFAFVEKLIKEKLKKATSPSERAKWNRLYDLLKEKYEEKTDDSCPLIGG